MMQSITFVALTLLAASGVNAGTQKTIAPTPAMVTPEPATPAPVEVTPEPTAAPTPCGNRRFYIVTIDGITKCSNGYDSETDFPDFFDTSTECCDYLTDENMLDADDYCKVIDVCNPTEAPTDSPTPAPFVEIESTPSPTPEPTPSPVSDEPTVKPTCAPTTCEGRRYYIITDIDGVEKCSNGMDNTDGMDDEYDSLQECCNAAGFDNGNGPCKYIDVCNPTDEPTPAPTLAPIEALATPAPVTPAPIETPVLETPAPTPAPIEVITPAPIEVIIPAPTPAPIETPVETPAPTPCEGRKWYLITSEADGWQGDGSTTCTNGYDATTIDGGASMYDTFQECCEAEAKETMDSTDCTYIDVCNPPAPTPAPVPDDIVTNEPTNGASIVSTPSLSIGSTPTVGTEKDILAIASGPRRLN